MKALEQESWFPIMGWDWVASDPDGLPRMREAGLTVAGFAQLEELDAVHAEGLKAIVSGHPRIAGLDWNRPLTAGAARDAVRAFLDDLDGHPAAWGVYLRDEPGAGHFGALGAVMGEFRRQSPPLWPYVNLFPAVATAEQLGAATYEEYLTRYLEICRPPILSYDNYTIMEDGSIRPDFWTNLESVRAAAQRSGIPFQSILLSVAHFNFREPTAADLRVQVFSALAHGARGLAYFTYLTPRIGNYRGAPIDAFGEKTPLWDDLRHLNRQVHALAPTLLRLRSDAVYHFGAVPPGASEPASATLVAAVRGAPFLVGDFTDGDGGRYAMIVNRDTRGSHLCRPVWRASGTTARRVSPFTSREEPYTGEQQWLAPGQGVLLKLKPPTGILPVPA